MKESTLVKNHSVVHSVIVSAREVGSLKKHERIHIGVKLHSCSGGATTKVTLNPFEDTSMNPHRGKPYSCSGGASHKRNPIPLLKGLGQSGDLWFSQWLGSGPKFIVLGQVERTLGLLLNQDSGLDEGFNHHY